MNDLKVKMTVKFRNKDFVDRIPDFKETTLYKEVTSVNGYSDFEALFDVYLSFLNAFGLDEESSLRMIKEIIEEREE